jgi:hypothetical protein
MGRGDCVRVRSVDSVPGKTQGSGLSGLRAQAPLCFSNQDGKSPLYRKARTTDGEFTSWRRFGMDISCRIKDTIGSLHRISEDVVVHLHFDVTTELRCFHNLVTFEFYVTSIDRTCFTLLTGCPPRVPLYSSFFTQRPRLPASVGQH